MLPSLSRCALQHEAVVRVQPGQPAPCTVQFRAKAGLLTTLMSGGSSLAMLAVDHCWACAERAVLAGPHLVGNAEA